jgi:hypothetical protein
MSFSESFEILTTSGMSILQVVLPVAGGSVVSASVGSGGSIVADSVGRVVSLAAVVGPIDLLGAVVDAGFEAGLSETQPEAIRTEEIAAMNNGAVWRDSGAHAALLSIFKESPPGDRRCSVEGTVVEDHNGLRTISIGNASYWWCAPESDLDLARMPTCFADMSWRHRPVRMNHARGALTGRLSRNSEASLSLSR